MDFNFVFDYFSNETKANEEGTWSLVNAPRWGDNMTVMNFIIFISMIYLLSFIDFKENLNIIICIIVASVYMYFYLKKKDTDYKTNTIKPSNVIKKKYIYLNDYHELQSHVNGIHYMRKYCKRTYDLSLKHLDNFLYYTEVLKRDPFAPQQVFDILKDCRKNCLNSFSSILLSLPVNSNRNNQKTTTALENFLFELETMLDNIIKFNGKKINDKWKTDIKKDNNNMYKGPANINMPEPSPEKSELDSNIFY